MELAQKSESLSTAQEDLNRLRQEKAELATKLEETSTVLEGEKEKNAKLEGDAKSARRSEKETSVDLLTKLQAQAQQVLPGQ